MSDPFVAEIRIFPFNFAPKGWAFCDGQLLPLSQNTALFSLLGTTYGGDGKSNFALPDFQGRAPMHAGQGNGLSQRFLGEEGGVENVNLIQAEMPLHNHNMMAVTADATVSDPNGAIIAQGAWSFQGNGGVVAQYSTNPPNALMSPLALQPAGGGLPHTNMQPYLTLNFCMALQGVFPPRT